MYTTKKGIYPNKTFLLKISNTELALLANLIVN